MKWLLLLFFNLFIILSIQAQSLQQALDKKDTITALQIIKKGYNLDSVNSFGSSILMDNCRYTYDTLIADFLLRHGAKADFPKSPKGRTPLIIASAYYGGVPLCRVLLNHGANVNAVTVNGETALMLAASNEKSDLVAFLLQRGADPKLLDKSGKGALDYAKSANIDDDLKKAMKCCEPDKEKTIAILTKAVSK
ncbi:MAG: ankyrin repeat domain-containing protein [Bacteroidetes bacterium]|nr:MAG: ankyrin repeat domain-containing protein [Bacteroidota bacterium]